MMNDDELKFFRSVWVKTRMIGDISTLVASLVFASIEAMVVLACGEQPNVVSVAVPAFCGFGICAILMINVFSNNADHIEFIVREDAKGMAKSLRKLMLYDSAVRIVFYASFAFLSISFLALTTGW